jgi:DNA-binding beta-propeller fold protein YncE
MSGISKKLMTAFGGVDPAWDLDYAYYDSTEGVGGWSIAGAKYLYIKSIAAQELSPTGLFFKPDGTKMYIIGTTGDDVNEYDLSTPWLATTAVFLQSFSVAAQDATPTGLYFTDDGLNMYVLGDTGNDVNQYALGIAWDVSTAATYKNSVSVAAQEINPTGIFFKPDGTKMYVIGNSGDDVNEYDLSAAWDFNTAVFLQNFSVSAQETIPTGLFFKPDGTKMYIIGITGDDVNEYDLSAAWDVSTAVYLQNFSVAGQETNPTGVFFKPDGLKMYIIGTGGVDVNEYDLSTAWDVSTAVYLQNFSVSAQETLVTGVSFKPDGTKMFIIGTTGDDVNEYDLSTAWDVSTAVYLQTSPIALTTTPEGVFFGPDGTKMYVVSSSSDTVIEYILSTAWDTSTAALYTALFSVGSQTTQPSGMTFKPDGTRMYVTDPTFVYEYALSAPWFVGSATFTQSLSVLAQETLVTGVSFKPDGTKMFIIGTTGDDVNEYDLSAAWDVSTAVFLQLFSVSGQETAPQDIFFKPDGTVMYILGATGDDINAYALDGFSVAAQETTPNSLFFKPDGTKMYILGATGDDVNEYDLSTAWDLNTAVFLQNFSIGTQEATPQGLFFRPDGLKMYIIGTGGDDVNEYDLSTAWDVSTAVFLQVFSVAGQEINPTGVFFKPDGLKMYMCGLSGDDVNEYDLSTAWDVSTAVFLQLFSVSAEVANPDGVFFKPDGTKMFVVTGADKDINGYNLSTAWDVSTAVFLQNFSVSTQAFTPKGVFFRPDGTKMYVVDISTDKVFAYTLGIQV